MKSELDGSFGLPLQDQDHEDTVDDDLPDENQGPVGQVDRVVLEIDEDVMACELALCIQGRRILACDGTSEQSEVVQQGRDCNLQKQPGPQENTRPSKSLFTSASNAYF